MLKQKEKTLSNVQLYLEIVNSNEQCILFGNKIQFFKN